MTNKTNDFSGLQKLILGLLMTAGSLSFARGGCVDKWSQISAINLPSNISSKMQREGAITFYIPSENKSYRIFNSGNQIRVKTPDGKNAYVSLCPSGSGLVVKATVGFFSRTAEVRFQGTRVHVTDGSKKVTGVVR